MRRTFIFCLLFILVSAGTVYKVWAEDEPSDELLELADLTGKSVRIETYGGGSFQGTLFSIGEDRVEIIDSAGQILQISSETIKMYREIPAGKSNRNFYQDSASNRLIVTPTGFPMEPGELHITDQEIIVVTSSYGLNKNVSFWGGISPMGLVISARFVAMFTESLGFSVGSFAGVEWIGEFEESESSPIVSGLLMPYTLLSWGEPNNNITTGGAVVFRFNRINGFETIGAIAMLGGKVVLTATTALVTENWIVWGKRNGTWDAVPLFIVPGLVFRIAGSRFSWDIGGVLPLLIERDPNFIIHGIGEDLYIPLPLISMTYRIK
ncbi:MAG: hypothetical protein KAU17_15045 [Spirochaetales bacterium]|nr:hypothetical protein [Spirochaetales bacterium]